MRIPKLSPQQKRVIGQMYYSGDRTMEQLAQAYNVNRRTIQRALLEQGYLPKVTMASTKDREILAVIRDYERSNRSDRACRTLIQRLASLLRPPAQTHRAA